MGRGCPGFKKSPRSSNPHGRIPKTLKRPSQTRIDTSRVRFSPCAQRTAEYATLGMGLPRTWCMSCVYVPD
eukprot:scaffold82090_cov31-Prasinocladus_malaysianus.AAC.1